MHEYSLSFNSLIGEISLIGDQNNILKILINSKNKIKNSSAASANKNFLRAKQQILDYLSGKLENFSFNYQLKATKFQQNVLTAVKSIPFGQTACYQDIALKIGNPKAARAIGRANNANPLPIVFPCHRVIGKNNQLVGYEFGLDVKQHLLAIEGVYFD